MMEIINCEQVHRLFVVDEVAGRFFWKIPPRTHPRLLGKEAGSIKKTHSGKLYWMIKIGGTIFNRSRLMYLHIHGRFPYPCVDHVNGNSLDDRPDNLREATITENAWNHKFRARRIDLPMGVRLIQSSGRYQARISCNKKQIHIGAYDTPEEAHAAYVSKRKELFHEFA